MNVLDIQARARRRERRMARKRADPRFRRVLGRYVAAGLLHTNQVVELQREPLRVADVLWAGEIEPRLLELLPALLVKKPAMFVDGRALPEDLEAAVTSLRRGKTPAPFRGIAGEAIRRWLPNVGHRNKLPSQLKAFRLRPEDLELLAQLQRELGGSQTAILRRALRSLAATRKPAAR